MKTFDEVVTWAKGRHAEAAKIAKAYVPSHIEKREKEDHESEVPPKTNGKKAT